MGQESYLGRKGHKGLSRVRAMMEVSMCFIVGDNTKKCQINSPVRLIRADLSDPVHNWDIMDTWTQYFFPPGRNTNYNTNEKA